MHSVTHYARIMLSMVFEVKHELDGQHPFKFSVLEGFNLSNKLFG